MVKLGENVANKIHITDDKALNERFQRIYGEVWDILDKEKATGKDVLWLCFLLEEDVRAKLHRREEL